VDEKEKELSQERQRLDEEKQKNRVLIDSARKLGLIRVVSLLNRDFDQQCRDYSEAKKQIYIIAVAGSRILDRNYRGGNPIPDTIQKLLNDGVSINLMMYSSGIVPDSVRKGVDVATINKNLAIAKKLSAGHTNFKVKQLDKMPPFHGDLIDFNKAHIFPIRLDGGIHATKDPNLESYTGEGERMSNIINDFEHLWKNARSV